MDFEIEREFDAPKDLLWDVFTKKEHLEKWWGPKGFEMLKSNIELVPNGVFHYGMKSPEGYSMWGKFVYKEIKPKDFLSFVVSFSDENCGTTRHPMSETWPLEVYNETYLIEKGNKTILKMKGRPINASDEEINTYESNFANMQQGFKGTYDQLDEYLKTIV